MGNMQFKDLIISENPQKRWYPTSIETYRQGFALDSNTEGYHPLVDNLSYNLQYLEFLGKELSEFNLSDVLRKMIIKNFIIVGMGILEGVFSNLIKTNGWWNTTDLEEYIKSSSEQQIKGGDIVQIQTIVYKKVEPKETKMVLDDMIKCLNKRHAALSVKYTVYPKLKQLKDLRNHIHLQNGKSNDDSDWNCFNDSNYQEMRDILYTILTSNSVTKETHKNNFDFLKPDCSRYINSKDDEKIVI